MISKCHQHFSTKRFQQNPHNAYVENSIGSLMTPKFDEKARYVVVSVVTDIHILTHTVTLAHAPRINHNQ